MKIKKKKKKKKKKREATRYRCSIPIDGEMAVRVNESSACRLWKCGKSLETSDGDPQNSEKDKTKVNTN
jgi:hypothetical protein